MIAIDTNVLVRFLVRDDEANSRAHRHCSSARNAPTTRCFSPTRRVRVGLNFQRAYRVPKAAIVSTLNELVRARHIELEAADRVQRAVAAYAAGRGDFADYLVREQARAAGCDSVSTFDAAVAKESGLVKA